MSAGSGHALETWPVRTATEANRIEWLAMRQALWPDSEPTEHRAETARILAAGAKRVALLCMAPEGATAVGLIELSRRARVDGCTTSPVAYVEGLFVRPDHRRRSVARALIEAGEAWARARGCTEIAFGSALGDTAAQAVHGRLGFEETGRRVLFRKPVAPVREVLNIDAPAAPGLAEPVITYYPADRRHVRLAVRACIVCAGTVCFYFTDISSHDVLRGAVLPILDAVFVIYVMTLFVVARYRRRRGSQERGEMLFQAPLASERDSLLVTRGSEEGHS